MEHGACGMGLDYYYFRDLRKFVILPLNCAKSPKILLFSEESISFLLLRITIILAHSNVERRAILRNCENSLSENEPDPSAILFDILIPAPLNCSAKRNSFLFSALSAISKSLSASSIESVQILKSSNLNCPIFYR